MDQLYNVFKLLHVVAAIVWVGGICTLTVFIARLTAERDQAVFRALLRQVTSYGQFVIAPAMGITLLAGIATAARAGFPFSQLWITWGFIGIIVSFLLGLTLIRPAVMTLGRLAATAEPDDTRMAGPRRRLVTLYALNLALLLSVVAAMVVKPTL
jgi:uncharacterized membrane protein